MNGIQDNIELMEIKTKYNLGERVWVINTDTMRAKHMPVNVITISKHEVRYGETEYDTYPEHLCFASMKGLIEHVSVCEAQ